jgi:aldehyde:ferredoxin oxidoreductase
MLKRLKDHQATRTYRNLGTTIMVRLLNPAGAFPTHYWSQGKGDQWEKISSLVDRRKARPKACRTCFMAFGNYIEAQEGRHRALKLEGPEHETIYAFKGLYLTDKIEEIAYLNRRLPLKPPGGKKLITRCSMGIRI